MKARKIRTLLASALVLGAMVLGAPSTPASADPGDVHLAINTWSPVYIRSGCIFRIIYGNYGSAPYAGIRAYNSTCLGMEVSVKSADSNGVHWTTSSTIAHDGIASVCGSYYAIQATGPNPGYGIGARFDTGTTTVTFASDGTDTLAPPYTCA